MYQTGNTILYVKHKRKNNSVIQRERAIEIELIFTKLIMTYVAYYL